ncbi:MAG: HAD family hydrolase [Armatimonadetes bacterium]|nr:HAD family hydrolase [Armatimonadota bacterium]NCO92411.1 HAD family hydrolase [Armatimonadota bacterium]NCP31378.1 HAD family hydrolase [Armatimonadota bacterium]NCQ29663.1 HAD family hydrolase [Armatimonadota bacterium]NDK14366.1 HAD family hydrolase [Armatimonadota bacterium]
MSSGYGESRRQRSFSGPRQTAERSGSREGQREGGGSDHGRHDGHRGRRLASSSRLAAPSTAILPATSPHNHRHQFALVGDSLESDIGAANAAGVVGIWVNREGARRQADGPVPDFAVAELVGIVELLGFGS